MAPFRLKLTQEEVALPNGRTVLLDIVDSVEEAVERLRPKLTGIAGQRLHPRTAAG